MESYLQDREAVNTNVFIDTVVFLCRIKPSNKIATDLKSHCTTVGWRRSRTGQWRLVLQQPNTNALAMIAERGVAEKVQQLDVALDLDYESEHQALAMTHWLNARLMHRWRGGEIGPGIEDHAIYSTRKRWGGIGWTCYGDKRSKITGLPCCHIELRLRGAQPVKNQRLNDPEQLARADLEALMNKKMALKELDFKKLGRKLRKHIHVPANYADDHAGRRWARLASQLAGRDGISSDAALSLLRHLKIRADRLTNNVNTQRLHTP